MLYSFILCNSEHHQRDFRNGERMDGCEFSGSIVGDRFADA